MFGAVVPFDEDADRKFKRETRAIICCGIVTIGVAVGVSLAFAFTQSDPVSMTPASPTEASTPTPTSLILTKRAEIIREAVKDLSSNPTVLEDPTSPQFLALTWLADLDEAAIDPADSRRLETRYALATTYFATAGNGWLEDLGFLSSAHECEWSEFSIGNTIEPEPRQAGVYCNSDGRIMSLNLDGNNLVGAIPEEIKAFTDLRFLSLKSNKFSDNQASLDAVKSLQSISQLKGSLILLDVSDNAWDAVLSTDMGQLSNLEILHLNNNLFRSTLPAEFSNLSHLRELYLDGNERMTGRIDGGIEDILLNMAGLEVLSAARAGNFRISPDLRFPTSLGLLNLEGCNFNDSELTTSIGRLSNLRTLSLKRSKLVGAIPTTELGLLTGLAAVDLSENALSGKIPWSTLNPATLTRLYLERNEQLTGGIPSDIGRFTMLEYLDLKETRLGGRIPESIGNLTSLIWLDIANTGLTGPLPSTIGSMASLRVLRLSSNSMTGTLPPEMSNMESLELATLFGNNFTGGDLEFICSRYNYGGTISANQNIVCSCCGHRVDD